jgi:hypothetical protein
MLVDPLIARIAAEIPALAGRVEGAAELSELVRRNELPNVTPHAYVLPLGLRPLGQGEAGANAFSQDIEEVVGVVVVQRAAGDRTGWKALPTIDTLRDQLLTAIAGWAPDEAAIGVFRLQRAAIVSVSAGVVIYQIDFAIQLQLRNLA